MPLRLGLRRLPRLLYEKFRDDLINHLVNQRAHFIRGFGLDGMGDKNWLVLREAERGTLGLRGTHELGRSDIRGRDSAVFEGDYIVRTARNAAPSIA